MKKYVYIFVEVARRELDSRLAIAIKLAKEGHHVVIGEKNQLLWNMFAGKYPPGVILDKCAQLAEHKRFDYLMRKGFVYTVLDEEGLLTNKEYFNSNRFSKKAEKYTSANFVTGNNLNQIILDKYPNAKNIISGNPRYSMLHAEWKHWFEEEYNTIKKQYGKFVLIISSFNPYPQAYLNAIPGMKEVDEYFKLKMEEYLTDNKNSDLNFVLRPHPSDQPFNYQSIQIDDRYNIIPWIMASEYIINAKCTTSLEAFIAGKRAYTWKYRTNEPVYKLANLFADDISELNSQELKSIHDKRKKILNNLLAYFDSADLPLNIISSTISNLAFFSTKKTSERPVTHRFMHIKNRIRFLFLRDNYNRITQKFTKKHVEYAEKKIKMHDLYVSVSDKVLTIKSEN